MIFPLIVSLNIADIHQIYLLTCQCEYIQLSFLRIAEMTDDFIVGCTIGISTMEKKDWQLLW